MIVRGTVNDGDHVLIDSDGEKLTLKSPEIETYKKSDNEVIEKQEQRACKRYENGDRVVGQVDASRQDFGKE